MREIVEERGQFSQVIHNGAEMCWWLKQIYIYIYIDITNKLEHIRTMTVEM